MINFQFGFSIVTFMVKLLVRSVLDEFVSISEMVKNSGLNWTIVRLSMLTDKAQKNKIAAGYLGSGKINLFWLNRNNLATLSLIN